MIQERANGVAGLAVEVRQVDPVVATPASFLVTIDWPGGRGIVCEVADSIDGVRVMDDDARDVTIDAALRYVEARLHGQSRGDARRRLV